MRTKTNQIFSTITFQDGEIPQGFSELLITYFVNHSTSYVIIQETGAYGKNNHYHVFSRLKRESGTDTITRAVRKLYPNTINQNRHTVLTKVESDPIYRLGYYFQKEVNYIMVSKSDDIDLNNYKTLYNNRQSLANKILKTANNKQYTINQLPSVYLAYCDEKAMDYHEYAKVFSMMIRDGYIQVSQLKNLKWVKLQISILKGEDLEDNILMII